MAWARQLWRPLVIGFAIREALSPWTGHYDFEIWVRLGVWLQSGASPYLLLPHANGLSFLPYPKMTSISYPPLPAFMFAIAYKLYLLLGAPSQYLYYLIIKQITVLSDLGVAFLLYKLLLMKGDPDQAHRVSALWLYFPFAIVISSIWGALDPAALLLILSAAYFFETGKPSLSAVALGLSIFLKLMPLIFVPVFLLSRSLILSGRGRYAAISLSIPILGTVIPFVVLGWNYMNVYAAISYQADLPIFGGMSIFLPFALIGHFPRDITLIVGWAWIPALLAGYYYIRAKGIGLVEALLIIVLVFSVSRPAMPEQWALYPIAFLLLMRAGEARRHFLAITAIASAFLVTNNFLLVRFFSPITMEAFNWDSYIDSSSVISDVRYAVMVAVATLFFAEAVSTITRRGSLLMSKVNALTAIKLRDTIPYFGYFLTVGVAGALLDFTVTSMVTDWHLALESRVLFGLSWISLYHIMLVVVFEILAIVVALSGRRGLSGSVRLLILLTSLNFAAAGLSLVLFRLFEGAALYTTTPIYLAGSILVTERFFVTFAFLICGLGILYQSEFRRFIVALASAPGSSRSTPGGSEAR